jgi:hypothetical protein
MKGQEFELSALSHTTSGSSSFDRNFRRRVRETRRLDFQSSDAPSNQAATGSIGVSHGSLDETALDDYPLLLCLQLIAHHNVPVFSVRRGRKWNTREVLGRGSTFAVEQADLPVREALSDLQYYDITKGRRHGCFTDHTGIKWSYDTVVAYKSLNAKGRRNRKDRYADLLQELRILCHPPLQRHPNIACFIGVAWIREEDMLSGPDMDSVNVSESQEWPILVTEKADLGTLGEFVKYRADCMNSVSLPAKVRLVSDVLEAISVSSSASLVPPTRSKNV